MKTKTRVKKINGHEYLYEITYYYDKETHRTRQKSKYLGKNIDGKPVRIREKAKNPENVFAFGEFIPYYNAITQLNLNRILSDHLTESEKRLFLTLTLAILIEPAAISNLLSWYEGTVLSKTFHHMKISANSIAKLIKKLGEGSLYLELCQSFVEENSSTEMKSYNLSLPSLFKNVESDDNFNEQIIVYYDKEKNKPVAYIPNIKNLTVSSLIKSAESGITHFKGRKNILVSLRDFSSLMNLYSFIFSGSPFLIKIPASHPILKTELKKIRTDLMQPKNLKIFRGQTSFVVPITIDVEAVQVYAHVIYSPLKEDEIRNEFEKNLNLIHESLQHIPLYRWMNPAETVKDVAGKYEQFIQWKVVNNRLEITTRPKLIEKHLRDAGISVILTSESDVNWDNALEWFDEIKEDEAVIRDTFKSFSNYFISSKNEVVKNGTICISFVALMMKRWVIHQMKESGMLNVSTPEKILIELRKIHIIELGNDQIIVAGPSPKQMEILNTLKWKSDVKFY